MNSIKYKNWRRRIERKDNLSAKIAIIKTNPSQEEIFRTLKELDDQPLTFTYIKQCGEPLFRSMLLQLISNQEMLEDLAKNDNSPRLRQRALARLKNKRNILEILKKEQDGWVISEGLNLSQINLEHQIGIMNHHKAHPAIEYFIQESLNQQLLFVAAKNLHCDNLREKAFSRLLLEQLADEEKLALLRNCKSEQITPIIQHLDKATLTEIKKGGSATLIHAIDQHLQDKPAQSSTLPCTG